MSCPRIGITVNRDYGRERYWLPVPYCRRVEAAGGVAILLPPAAEAQAPAMVAALDGLLLSGGGDVAPFFFFAEPRPGLGEVDPERDRWELALVRAALRTEKPILGICRGLQVLNVALGGGMLQHLAGEGYLQHQQKAPRLYPSHTVEVLPGTRLAALAGEGTLAVNSFHHQAVLTPAPGLKVSARAPDGVVEALESESGGRPFVLAVQWHPETLDHPASHALFRALVAAAP